MLRTLSVGIAFLTIVAASVGRLLVNHMHVSLNTYFSGIACNYVPIHIGSLPHYR